jgi:hypothetical protein
MNFIKIKGTKGVTICYKIENIRIENGVLKWDSFYFYTPEGDLTNANGIKYFIVPAKEYTIPDRDPLVDIEIEIIVTKNGGVEPTAFFAGTTNQPFSIGLEGDVIVTGYIPADTNVEIEITAKEVTG